MQLVVRQKYNWLAHGNTIGCYSKIQFVVSRKYNWLTVLYNNLTILGDVNTSKYKQVHAMMGILPLICNYILGNVYACRFDICSNIQAYSEK